MFPEPTTWNGEDHREMDGPPCFNRCGASAADGSDLCEDCDAEVEAEARWYATTYPEEV